MIQRAADQWIKPMASRPTCREANESVNVCFPSRKSGFVVKK